jgi:hypothetical protein
VPSKLKTSRIVGWNAIGSVDRVNEREEYKEIKPPDEKSQTIVNLKYGGLLSLTREDIFFDQTGELVDRARQIGERGAQKRAALIYDTACVTDAGGNGTLFRSGSVRLGQLERDHGQSLAPPVGKRPGKNCSTRRTSTEPIWVMGDKPILIVGSDTSWPPPKSFRRTSTGI